MCRRRKSTTRQRRVTLSPPITYWKFRNLASPCMLHHINNNSGPLLENDRLKSRSLRLNVFISIISNMYNTKPYTRFWRNTRPGRKWISTPFSSGRRNYERRVFRARPSHAIRMEHGCFTTPVVVGGGKTRWEKIEKTDKNLISTSCVRVCTHNMPWNITRARIKFFGTKHCLSPPGTRVNDVYVCVCVPATCRAYIGVTPCILPANRAAYNIHGCYNWYPDGRAVLLVLTLRLGLI